MVLINEFSNLNDSYPPIANVKVPQITAETPPTTPNVRSKDVTTHSSLVYSRDYPNCTLKIGTSIDLLSL